MEIGEEPDMLMKKLRSLKQSFSEDSTEAEEGEKP